MSKRKFIIDCDVGTDDAQAILMALSCQDIEVLCITAVFGNSDLQFTAPNTLRVLKVAGRLDIPVYRGCNQSLLGVPSVGDGYHGEDGLGDHDDYHPPDEKIFQKEHATLGLINAVNKHPGAITLVCTGPLTNIATALMLDHSFGKKLKDCYIMGGNSEGRGNIVIAQEFNFFSDQEAAYSTLNNLGCPITIIPYEICCRNAFSWEWYDKFASTPTELGRFIKAVEKKMNDRERKKGSKKYVAIWDQLAMAVAIDNSVATESIKVYATVELQGSLTRGQMVVDWAGKLEKTPNVTIPMEINQELFSKLLYQGIGVKETSSI